MVMRLLGEEAALCLKNRDKRTAESKSGGSGGLLGLLDPTLKVGSYPGQSPNQPVHLSPNPHAASYSIDAVCFHDVRMLCSHAAGLLEFGFDCFMAATLCFIHSSRVFFSGRCKARKAVAVPTDSLVALHPLPSLHWRMLVSMFPFTLSHYLCCA